MRTTIEPMDVKTAWTRIVDDRELPLPAGRSTQAIRQAP